MSNDAERLLAETLLQVKKLTEEVSQLRSLIAGSPVHIEGWATAGNAARALQADGVRSAKHLQQLRLDGAFSEARGEIRNVSKGGTMPRWEYNIPKCRAALQRHFRRLRSVS